MDIFFEWIKKHGGTPENYKNNNKNGCAYKKLVPSIQPLASEWYFCIFIHYKYNTYNFNKSSSALEEERLLSEIGIDPYMTAQKGIQYKEGTRSSSEL